MRPVIRPPHIPARHWYAMSWHARDKATRRYMAALEAERPAPRPPTAVVVGPYSRLDARPEPIDRQAVLRLTIGLIARELATAPPPARHGTKVARERHHRLGEPLCDPCARIGTVVRPLANRTPPAVVARIRELRAAGHTLRAIAEEVGVAHSTVQNHTRSTYRIEEAA